MMYNAHSDRFVLTWATSNFCVRAFFEKILTLCVYVDKFRFWLSWKNAKKLR